MDVLVDNLKNLVARVRDQINLMLKIDADGDVVDDVNFTGTATAVDQDSQDPQSILTVGQADTLAILRSMETVGQVIDLSNHFSKVYKSVGVTTELPDNGRDRKYMRLGNVPAGSWSRMSLAYYPNAFAGSGSKIPGHLPLTIAGVIMTYLSPADDVYLRMVVGGPDLNNTAPPAAGSAVLTARGWGFEIFNVGGMQRIRLFAHDGTNYLTSPDAPWDSGNNLGRPFMLEKRDSVLKMYSVSGMNTRIDSRVPLLTLSGLATTGTSGGSYIEMQAIALSAAGHSLIDAKPNFKISSI